MEVLEIEGGKSLKGTIRISGAKNSSVALIPASILSDEGAVTLLNVPEIKDTDSLTDILAFIGADVERSTESMVIDSTNVTNKEIPEEFAKKLRASYYFMGAMLGKYKHAELFFPGGCSIGERPINLHLKGFEALGGVVTNIGKKYIVDAKELKGADIYLDIASVGATINIMLAAVKAKGVTRIENAAKEPEIVDVAMLLNSMGAKIEGAGTNLIKITGVDKLHGCSHEIIPDRIEAGTYMIIGAVAGNYLKIDNVIPKHLEALISTLEEMNVELDVGDDYVIVNKPEKYKPVVIKTLPYPGFPTDLQQPFSVLMTQAEGDSKITETIWENRFMHVPHLVNMGANIDVSGMKAFIHGPTKLYGTIVEATDLRAGATMVAAAIIAEGKTTITNINHILRGYENIVEKLSDVGASIKRVEVED
ncbi:MAG: UDP-N-acetylglucosamine 1-carboxyvinyltransferase [Bacilli bacterium]|nr:UDP-N-acetylglucosamine 1-carboxyvinyltransferase [Bacilli bacterium]